MAYQWCHSRCPTHRTWCGRINNHTGHHIGGFAGCDCTWQIGYIEDMPTTLF